MVPEYVQPHAVPHRSAAISIAKFCAVGPLCLGTLIFLLFLITRDDGWAMFGLITLFAGGISFVVGFSALVIHTLSHLRSQGEHAKSTARQIVVIACLLLVNVPIAAIYARIGSALVGRYTVIIVNKSDSMIAVTLEGPGIQESVGPVEPKATMTRHYRFESRSDGRLTSTIVRGSDRNVVVLEAYVSGPFDGIRTITVTNEGAVVTPDPGN